MKGITIRHALPQDINAILTLWLEGTEHHQQIVPDDFRLSAEASEHYLRILTERLSKSNVAVLVAVVCDADEADKYKQSASGSGGASGS